MAIRMRNKKGAEFNTSSMSDLVFLLLIFFMLTSTLVSPNAVKLFLPSSDSKTIAKQNITVYIDQDLNFYVDKKENKVDAQGIEGALLNYIKKEAEATIVLKADKVVDIQNVLYVIDAINNINKANGTKHKLILATSPK